nr:hypothetical protein [Tanacetum cinerariifolium]
MSNHTKRTCLALTQMMMLFLMMKESRKECGEEVFVAGQNENVVEEVVDAAQVSTATTTVTITTEEITLAQALKSFKTSKPKVKGIVYQEPERSTRLDEEAAKKSQAEFNEEERHTREKAKKEERANIDLIETWDDIQAKIDDDHQLAERLQAQEQEELSDLKTLEQSWCKAKKREQEQEITKKQKVEDDKEKAKLKQLMETILDEVAIDAILVESSGDEESLGEDSSKQRRRIDAIDVDEDITLVSVQDDADNEMFDVDDLGGEEVFVAGQNENVVEEVVDAAQVSTATTTVTITTEEITLAQALKSFKTSKPKVKGIVFQEPERSTRLDEEATKKSQAEFDEEERHTREKAKKEERANIDLIETCDDIQAKIDADHQLAKRLQAQEQEELSDTLEQSWCKAKKREQEQEITKKQKVEDDKEKAELKQLMETILDEVAIDAILLALIFCEAGVLHVN